MIKKLYNLHFFVNFFFYIIKTVKMNARKFIKSQINMFILDIVSISLNPKKMYMYVLSGKNMARHIRPKILQTHINRHVFLMNLIQMTPKIRKKIEQLKNNNSGLYGLKLFFVKINRYLTNFLVF